MKTAGVPIHKIWKNIHHLTFYKERLLKRLTGEKQKIIKVTNNDTFVVPSAEPSTWKESVKKMDHAHQSIVRIIAKYNERDLERKIPDSIDTWLYSLILHNAYHTGQIVQLCKMQGSWPSERSFGHS